MSMSHLEGRSIDPVASREIWKMHKAHQGGLKQATAEVFLIVAVGSILGPIVVAGGFAALAATIDTVSYGAHSASPALILALCLAVAIWAVPVLLLTIWAIRRLALGLSRLRHHLGVAARVARHEIRRGLRVERSAVPDASNASMQLLITILIPVISVIVGSSMCVSMIEHGFPLFVQPAMVLTILSAVIYAPLTILGNRDCPFEATLAIRRIFSGLRAREISVPQSSVCIYCRGSFRSRSIVKRSSVRLHNLYIDFVKNGGSRVAEMLRTIHRRPLIAVSVFIVIGAIVVSDFARINAREVALLVSVGLGVGLLRCAIGRNLGEIMFPEHSWKTIFRSFGYLIGTLAVIANYFMIVAIIEWFGDAGWLVDENNLIIGIAGFELVVLLVSIVAIYPSVGVAFGVGGVRNILWNSLWILLPIIVSAVFRGYSQTIVFIFAPLAIRLFWKARKQ